MKGRFGVWVVYLYTMVTVPSWGRIVKPNRAEVGGRFGVHVVYLLTIVIVPKLAVLESRYRVSI